MLSFPGTACNSTNGCNRSRTNGLVLSTNRFLFTACWRTPVLSNVIMGGLDSRRE
jgi:hypothetical protein